MDASKIPDDVLNPLVSTVNSFFQNDSYKTWKKLLWEFYSSTVYNGEQIMNGEENSAMLFKYECLKRFLRDLNRLHKKIKMHEK
ncbi:hypothetical protein [Filimonas effusa]|uniref:Uncharacterized protein n=1 Tax=Filimonas effusa TaxID=2508721 RepID=A0A4Q1D5K2_9BACT|nr:hypothetical protein [Filimonas effusa]RXK83775.1 hypothetical protein ESB13_17020 [Filimonas effusa]